MNAIVRNQFNYADYFPNSNHAKRFGHAPSRLLMHDLLTNYLKELKSRVETSTYVRAKRVCDTHLFPRFGEMALQDISLKMLREWIQSLTCKRKTINNILTPLRHVIQRAVLEGDVADDPLAKINVSLLLKKSQCESEFVIDPFDREEIKAILEVAKGQMKNFYQFAFFTGLRPSELMGLRWQDVDWIHNEVRIAETIVDKQRKGPKTKAGYRRVMLLPPALIALKNQKAHTFLEGRAVFHNPYTGQAWEASQQLRRTVWIPLLKRAGVRYRNPYQTRHTYASMMLTAGENPGWLSSQMGHVNPDIPLKRYARWISNPLIQGGYQCRGNWGEFFEAGDVSSSMARHEPPEVNSPVGARCL